MVGGFIYFDTPIDTSVIEADIDALQSEMSTKVTQGGDDTGVFPLEVGTKTAQPFVITTNLLARIRVLANGRTLVQKTTDTGEALQVGGTVQADTVNSPNIGTTTAVDAKFCANNAEGLRVFNATQNVAIGSALDTGHKLSVLGLANFRSGIRIAGTGSTPFTVNNSAGSVLEISNGGQGGLSLLGANSSINVGNASFPQYQLNSRNALQEGSSTQLLVGSGYTNIAFRPSNTVYGIANASGFIYSNAAVGTIHPSAVAQFDSTTKGFAPPRMTTADRILIASPIEGLMVYDTTLKTYCFYDGTAWRKISHSLA